jgi:glycosyltransferase involved in cell wall biosynthesis
LNNLKKKIKVLWFAPVPGNGMQLISPNAKPGSGTWIGTLDLAIQKQVDLNIAFYHESASYFTFGETRYWSIARYSGYFDLIVKKIAERFFNFILNEQHLDSYLSVINKVQPDIIHIHGTENSFAAIIRRTNIPVVVSIQGLICAILNSHNGLSEKFLKVRNFSFNSLKNAIFPTHFHNTKLKFKNMAKREKNNLKETKFVIGYTNWDRRMIALLAPQSRYFYNGQIMRSKFYETRWRPKKTSSRKIVIHTTADNVYYKGLETIIAAIIHLREYGHKCLWRIAGVTSNDLIVRVLKKKFGRSFPNESLEWMGKLSAAQLIKRMLYSDCYVNASNTENSSNALCEAMLIGMPCIATNVGGHGDFIRDQKNGLLIQSGDSYALASCIVELKSNSQLAINYGKTARQEALIRHNPKTIVKDLISIYEKIIL